MKKTIDFFEFRNAFLDIRPENFSFEGLRVLWLHFEEWQLETGIYIDFDPVGICIDFMESTVAEALEEYNLFSIEQLEEQTIVLPIPDTDRIIYLTY